MLTCNVTKTSETKRFRTVSVQPLSFLLLASHPRKG